MRVVVKFGCEENSLFDGETMRKGEASAFITSKLNKHTDFFCDWVACELKMVKIRGERPKRKQKFGSYDPQPVETGSSKG
jgi:hypothetical protein